MYDVQNCDSYVTSLKPINPIYTVLLRMADTNNLFYLDILCISQISPQ
jgi:hypothetical protein